MRDNKLKAMRYQALRNMGATAYQAVAGRSGKGFQRIMDELEGVTRTWSQSVALWRRKTFGAGTVVACLERAKLEWDEMWCESWNLGNDNGAKLAEEIADVCICLAGVSAELGFDLAAEIEKKMVRNRARLWVSNGDGTGKHVP